MDPVLLSRIQFAVTIGFHFIFAPLTIGLSWLNLALMTRYLKTGADKDRQLAQFWIKVFALSFAVGVATGITMEFQFGTNWAAYSRFVGDIFGAPLAIESIFSFFLESVFIGVLLFGWDRISRKAQWFASLMVAVGATLSAFWILAAGSWMQTPAGYEIRNGRAELTNLWEAMINPSTIPRVLHTVDSAIATGAFFMLGLSAWFLWKQRHVEQARYTFRISLLVAFVTALGTLLFGHVQAVQVAETQPVKLAAIEGLFETRRNAPLLIFGLPDAANETVHYPIRIPSMLSVLVDFNPNTEVKGLNDFPKDQWPPLLLTFIPFHVMFLIGLFMIAFTALGVFLLWRRTVFTTRWYLFIAMLAIPLPFIANELGWMTAEIGRQPWIVYGLMRTRDAVSPTVPAGHILSSLIGAGLLYTILFIAWITFLRREMRRGPGVTGASTEVY